ncbi:MAG: hypothetical protein H6709_00625 [Kofleriaceae bacterium]|nr:hypothetical protein [Myxococcales bacterium]MCB9558872.1 hypothetical protein [Kofleriaceae bacterium]MCB9570571.1 hypothetical protein [Kofleriaceae bacterium]
MTAAGDATARAPAPAPSHEPIVLVAKRWDDAFEPLLCCEDGECRLDGCDAMLTDGDRVVHADGRTSAIFHDHEIDCPGSGDTDHRMEFRSPDPQPRAQTRLTIWPAEAAETMWWFTYVPHPDSVPLTAAEIAGLKRAYGLDATSGYLIDVGDVDLDGDGAPEAVLTASVWHGGTFIATDVDDAGNRTFTRLLDEQDPQLVGAIDLDGDGTRELLVLKTFPEPYDLFVIDVARREVRYRTKWFCREHPVSRQHGAGHWHGD